MPGKETKKMLATGKKRTSSKLVGGEQRKFDPIGDFKRFAHKVKMESQDKMQKMKNVLPPMIGPGQAIDRLKRKAGM